jgi:hypothetical protein
MQYSKYIYNITVSKKHYINNVGFNNKDVQKLQNCNVLKNSNLSNINREN